MKAARVRGLGVSETSEGKRQGESEIQERDGVKSHLDLDGDSVKDRRVSGRETHRQGRERDNKR